MNSPGLIVAWSVIAGDHSPQFRTSNCKREALEWIMMILTERKGIGKCKEAGRQGERRTAGKKRKSTTNEVQRPNEFGGENQVFPKSSLNLARWNRSAAVVFDSWGWVGPQLWERGNSLFLFYYPPSVSLLGAPSSLSRSQHWFLN